MRRPAPADWPGRPGGPSPALGARGESRLPFHPCHDGVSRSLAQAAEASASPRLPKVRSYLWSVQFGEPLQSDVTHCLAGTLKHPTGVFQVGAAVEREGYVPGKYVDAADAVLYDSFRRAIQQNNLGTHLEDVFMTRSHLLENHLPKAEGKRLDAGIVPIEELEQFVRRFLHAQVALELLNKDTPELHEGRRRVPLPVLLAAVVLQSEPAARR